MSLLPQSAVTNLELCYRPLHISQSVQPPAFQDTFTSPKPSHIHHEAQSSTNAYLKESAVQTLPFHLQGSQILPGELESSSRVSRVHGPELTACLSENIMEKVTEHLPERVKLTSPTIQTQPHKAFPATVPLHPHPPNDLSQGSGPSIRYSPALPSDQSTCIMPGPTVDDMERCKSELQDIQRCVCEQSEVLQQRQPLRPDLEMEQMRQQRETLQALINTDTKVRELTWPFMFIRKIHIIKIEFSRALLISNSFFFSPLWKQMLGDRFQRTFVRLVSGYLQHC